MSEKEEKRKAYVKKIAEALNEEHNQRIEETVDQAKKRDEDYVK